MGWRRSVCSNGWDVSHIVDKAGLDVAHLPVNVQKGIKDKLGDGRGVVSYIQFVVLNGVFLERL